MSRRVTIRVIPRASKNEIVGEMPDGTLKVKLTAPPARGAANEALIEFLSHEWTIPKTRLRIIRGAMGRKKMLEID